MERNSSWTVVCISLAMSACAVAPAADTEPEEERVIAQEVALGAAGDGSAEREGRGRPEEIEISPTSGRFSGVLVVGEAPPFADLAAGDHSESTAKAQYMPGVAPRQDLLGPDAEVAP